MIDLAIIIVLPKFGFLVWALVALLVSNGCSSRVHQFPITWSPRDRLKSMAGICTYIGRVKGFSRFAFKIFKFKQIRGCVISP